MSASELSPIIIIGNLGRATLGDSVHLGVQLQVPLIAEPIARTLIGTHVGCLSKANPIRQSGDFLLFPDTKDRAGPTGSSGHLPVNTVFISGVLEPAL